MKLDKNLGKKVNRVGQKHGAQASLAGMLQAMCTVCTMAQATNPGDN